MGDFQRGVVSQYPRQAIAGGDSRRAAMRQFTCHGLRHTAGTLTLANAASLEHAQAMLGHPDPHTASLCARPVRRAQNSPAHPQPLCLDA